MPDKQHVKRCRIGMWDSLTSMSEHGLEAAFILFDRQAMFAVGSFAFESRNGPQAHAPPRNEPSTECDKHMHQTDAPSIGKDLRRNTSQKLEDRAEQ